MASDKHRRKYQPQLPKECEIPAENPKYEF